VKTAALAVVLASMGAFSVVGIHAQQNQSNSASVRTNWVGYLVVGSELAIDRISPGPYPRADRQIEIGLRSDGVVVWRKADR
jgi:hypothetical protein